MKNEKGESAEVGAGTKIISFVFDEKANRKVVAPPLNLSHSLLLPYDYSLASTNIAVVAWLCIRTTMKPLSTAKVTRMD